MTNFLSRYTGASFDRLFQNFGLRSILVRYGKSLVLDPPPIVTPAGNSSINEVQSPFSDSEIYDAFDVSVPKETLIAMFGSLAAGLTVISNPSTEWWINVDGVKWEQCRIMGNNPDPGVVRYQFRLVKLGQNDY